MSLPGLFQRGFGDKYSADILAVICFPGNPCLQPGSIPGVSSPHEVADLYGAVRFIGVSPVADDWLCMLTPVEQMLVQAFVAVMCVKRNHGIDGMPCYAGRVPEPET